MTLVPLITDIAMKAGCTDRAKCEAVLADAVAKRISLVEALLDSDLVEEVLFAKTLAATTGLDFQEESELDLTSPLHNRFPAKIALRHRLLPASIDGKNMCLMTYDPFDLEAKQSVGRDLQKDVTWVVSTRYQIMEGLRIGYGVGAEHFDELIEGRDQSADDDDLAQEVTQLDEDDEEASVMNFVNQIFREALRERATDIHLEPLEKNLRIRYRVDGALQSVTVPPEIRALQTSLSGVCRKMAESTSNSTANLLMFVSPRFPV